MLVGMELGNMREACLLELHSAVSSDFFFAG